MKLDMHCHTHEGSPDSGIPIKEYITSLQKQGFDGMLVTDHNSYKGYLHYKNHISEMPEDFIVLKGIEYDTLDAGHILVIMPGHVHLHILEHRGLPVRLLIHLVHRYGGILGPAHPCGEAFLSIYSTGRFKKDRSITKDFDFIEGFNSAEVLQCSTDAQEIARQYGKPITGGSDSHKIESVGLAYTILEEMVHNEDELIAYIKERKPTQCGGEQFHGTLKEQLGPWNKLLVYGFFPYNKFGALYHFRKRRLHLKGMKKINL